MMAARIMSFWLIAALAVSAPSHADSPGGSAVRDSLERLAHAWNVSDAGAWAAEYWPDGELINILGAVLSGPGEVRDQTARILAGPFQGSHFAFTIRKLRDVGANTVIVETDVRVTGFRGLPPGIAPTQPGELQTRMKHVYERRRSRWRIIASQNTALIAAPPPP
jgi:uncharacterized protein (TIGR02246 family)